MTLYVLLRIIVKVQLVPSNPSVSFASPMLVAVEIPVVATPKLAHAAMVAG